MSQTSGCRSRLGGWDADEQQPKDGENRTQRDGEGRGGLGHGAIRAHERAQSHAHAADPQQGKSTGRNKKPPKALHPRRIRSLRGIEGTVYERPAFVGDVEAEYGREEPKGVFGLACPPVGLVVGDVGQQARRKPKGQEPGKSGMPAHADCLSLLLDGLRNHVCLDLLLQGA